MTTIASRGTLECRKLLMDISGDKFKIKIAIYAEEIATLYSFGVQLLPSILSISKLLQRFTKQSLNKSVNSSPTRFGLVSKEKLLVSIE